MNSPLPPNGEPKPATPEALDSRLFSQALRVASNLMDQVGATPLTYAGDRNNLNIFEFATGLKDKDIIGKETTMAGEFSGITYSFDWYMLNEAIGTIPSDSPSYNRIMDIHISAAEGSSIYLSADDYKQNGKGEIHGLLWLNSDRTIEADFGHGTEPSADPTIQRVLAKIVGYFGFEETEIFDERKTWYSFDDARLAKFIEGLRQLADNPLAV